MNDINNQGRGDNLESHIAVFKGKEISKTIHNNEWWFVVADVVEVLTDTVNSTDYIKKMRNRDAELSKGVGTNCHPPLWIVTPGGKQKGQGDAVILSS